MIQTAVQRDSTARWTFTASLLLHLLVIMIFSSADLFRARLQESIPYYVDIVSLPAAEPAPASNETTHPPSAAPVTVNQPAISSKPSMTLPIKQPQAKPEAIPPSQELTREQEAREFRERMGRIERSSDARHQSEAVAALQKRNADKKGTGSGTASGVKSGEDYGAYIQSRLKDALSANMVYRSQKPEAAVHLYIDKSGRLIKYVMIRPSPDKLFNSSVIRTIEKAKEEFPPVPNGKGFDKLYVFSPQEVAK